MYYEAHDMKSLLNNDIGSHYNIILYHEHHNYNTTWRNHTVHEMINQRHQQDLNAVAYTVLQHSKGMKHTLRRDDDTDSDTRIKTSSFQSTTKK